LLTAPWRLAMRVQRHGLGPIVAFAILSLRRHGVTGVIRMAVSDSRAGARPMAPEIAPAPDLDEHFRMSPKAWALWRPYVGAAPPHADAYHERFDDAAVLFLVQTEDSTDGDKLARTIASIAGLPTAQVVVLQGAEGRSAKPSILLSCGGGGVEAKENIPRVPPGFDNRFVVFLKAGDVPAPDFARELARAARRGVAEVVSFDMVRRDDDGVYPLLLPGANPTLLASVDYLFSRVALRGEALSEIGGEISELAAAEPRALLLKWLSGRPAAQVQGRWRHVGRPLLEVAVSADEVASLREATILAGRAPVKAKDDATVSVVICTTDKGRLLRQLVRSLLAYRPGAIAEILIFANNTTNPYALHTLADLAEEPNVAVLRRDTPVNVSKLSNAGARLATRGSHLLFLNDDITPVSEDWLDRLLSRFEDPDVAAVGPLLLYPDERVQHAGMYLGFDGRAGHTLRMAVLPDDDYLFTGVAPRETSCLTGAVLLVERAAFEAINGFDEQLATYLQDVDLGLRLNRIGRRNVFDPTAVLIHMESASIRSLEAKAAFHRQRAAEFARFQERWGAALKVDKFHPAGFDLQEENLRRLSGAGGVRPPMKDGVPLPAPQ
jgi:GT2 family glycosyltransferase